MNQICLKLLKILIEYRKKNQTAPNYVSQRSEQFWVSTIGQEQLHNGYFIDSRSDLHINCKKGIQQTELVT